MQEEPRCMVYDDLTLSERTALGISEQEWQDFQNLKTNFNSLNSNPIVPDDYTIVPKKFRIKFWKVQAETDTLIIATDTIYASEVGAFGLNYDLARRHVESLNHYFKDQSICFVLNGIGELKTDSIGDRFPKNFITIRQHAIDKNAYDPNAINVYIRKEIGSEGAAADRMNVITLKENPMYWFPYTTLAHEVGYAFGLIHTHGSSNRPIAPLCYDSDFATKCEHVTRNPNDPNYNALTHGDEVHDTAADPGLFGNPDPTGDYANCYNQDANCDYVGSQVDCQGTPYALDDSVLRNIMSYGRVECTTDFTPGQRRRMHYLIENDDSGNPNYTIDYSTVRDALIQPNDLTDFDLMVRNSSVDFGDEPDTLSTMFWQSPDIWVRNQNDSNDLSTRQKF